MSQQHGVVDLSLSEPGLLVSGGEDLDRDALTLPLTPPHFTVAALTWWAKTWGTRQVAVGMRGSMCLVRDAALFLTAVAV